MKLSAVFVLLAASTALSLEKVEKSKNQELNDYVEPQVLQLHQIIARPIFSQKSQNKMGRKSKNRVKRLDYIIVEVVEEQKGLNNQIGLLFENKDLSDVENNFGISPETRESPENLLSENNNQEETGSSNVSVEEEDIFTYDEKTPSKLQNEKSIRNNEAATSGSMGKEIETSGGSNFSEQFGNDNLLQANDDKKVPLMDEYTSEREKIPLPGSLQVDDKVLEEALKTDNSGFKNHLLRYLVKREDRNSNTFNHYDAKNNDHSYTAYIRKGNYVLPFADFRKGKQLSDKHSINKRQTGILNPPQSEAYATSNTQYAAALATANRFDNYNTASQPYGPYEPYGQYEPYG